MSQLVFRFLGFSLDLQHRRLMHNSGVLSDDSKIIALLEALAQHYPEAVSKQQLLDEVWGDVVVSEASLTKLVSQVRSLLAEHEEQAVIKTVHGTGYRLAAAPKRELESAAHTEQKAPASTEAVAPTSTPVLSQTAASAKGEKRHSLIILTALLTIFAFSAGAYLLPREKQPDSILGRWQLVDNNVVIDTQINADGYPFCEDTLEYLNAQVIQRDGAYILTSPLLEINLGLQVEYGQPLNANFSFRDGTGTTHTQLRITFDSPSKLSGQSQWTWEMDNTGVLCKGVSTMLSER